MIRSGTLPQGIPSINAYKNLLKTDFFREMESFSNAFLEAHSKALKDYSRRWVADPFHQWSRQWEYPFAYSYIQHFMTAKERDEVRILDGGSGCTFFPYYLSNRYPNCQISCCDNDSSLIPVFTEINKTRERVEFALQDLADLGYEDNFFDIVYCISVLEHTKKANEIIKQSKRVLKPKGIFILTFDISLDSENQISSQNQISGATALNLLSMINNGFTRIRGSSNDRKSVNVQKQGILTTELARKFGEELLPWRITCTSLLSQLRRLHIPKKPFFNLTVFCGAWHARQFITAHGIRNPK